MPAPNRTPRRPHPRESLERCALRAQLRGDPMLGTAFPSQRLLLVEQPGPWGHGGLRESRFGAEPAALLEALGRTSGVRVQAIRRPGRSPRSATHTWGLVDTRAGRQSVRWGSYADPRELLDLDLRDAGPDVAAGTDGPAGSAGVAGVVDREPVYLVCSHSKHDTCCALRGRPVAAALDAIRPGRVWESSHLGGDRFAASVLVLPSGLMYGRVLPFAAPEFVAAAEAGEVIGALLRGRIGLPPPAQAAVAFAHEHLGVYASRDLQVVATGKTVDGIATVRVRWPRGLLDVVVRVETVAATGLSCNNPRPNRYVAYRPVRIDPVDEDAGP